MNSISKLMLVTLLFAASCNQYDKGHKENNKKTEILKQTLLVEKNNEAPKITIADTSSLVNDEFIYDLSDKYLTFAYFKSKYLLKDKIPVVNNHYSSITDTIFKFRNDLNSAEFYVARENVILHNVIILQGNITNDERLKIGMSKQKIQDLFKVENIGDALKIEDFEKTTLVVLSFKNDVLVRFSYNSLYID